MKQLLLWKRESRAKIGNTHILGLRNSVRKAELSSKYVKKKDFVSWKNIKKSEFDILRTDMNVGKFPEGRSHKLNDTNKSSSTLYTDAIDIIGMIFSTYQSPENSNIHDTEICSISAY